MHAMLHIPKLRRAATMYTVSPVLLEQYLNNVTYAVCLYIYLTKNNTINFFVGNAQNKTTFVQRFLGASLSGYFRAMKCSGAVYQ